MLVKNRSSTVSRRQRVAVVLAFAVGLAFLGIGYAALVRRGIGIPCPFYLVTGLRCPGCGISRALAALLHGDAHTFLEYNLFSPIIVLYLLFVGAIATGNYIARGKFVYRPPYLAVDIGVLVATLLWWIARNLLGL